MERQKGARSSKGLRRKLKVKRILIVIFMAIIGIFILLCIINAISRERFELSSMQRGALVDIFPLEHLDKLKFYRGGLLAIGSTKVICNSIYINPRTSSYFFEDSDSGKSVALLVHEVTHTWQARGGCIRMSILSLSSQFLSYLRHGSRDKAYYYSLIGFAPELNVEQEAKIVADYYETSVSEEFKSNYCVDCSGLSRNDTINLLKEKTKEVIAKYE